MYHLAALRAGNYEFVVGRERAFQLTITAFTRRTESLGDFLLVLVCLCSRGCAFPAENGAIQAGSRNGRVVPSDGQGCDRMDNILSHLPGETYIIGSDLS